MRGHYETKPPIHSKFYKETKQMYTNSQHARKWIHVLPISFQFDVINVCTIYNITISLNNTLVNLKFTFTSNKHVFNILLLISGNSTIT